MSKKRNTHLRRALELACDEIHRLSQTSDDWEGIQASGATESDYWLQLAAANKEFETTHPEMDDRVKK